MTTDKFRRFEIDGQGQATIPLSVADELQVKPISGKPSLESIR